MEPDLRSPIPTPSVRAAADPASPFDPVQEAGGSNAKTQPCASCGQAVTGAFAPHLCASCGFPQPIHENEDIFGALGAQRSFAQDPAYLQTAFYERSRALHPDRYAQMGPGEAQRNSLERMSLLNRAYTILRDREQLRTYILEHEGVETPKAKAPVDIAEEWFEIQDLLVDDRAAALARLSGFEAMVRAKEIDLQARIRSFEDQLDQIGASQWKTSHAQGWFKSIAEDVQAMSYLKSLKRDLGRFK